MKTWEDVVALIFMSIHARITTQEKSVSRCRISVKEITALRNDGKPYLMYDDDWLALERALLNFNFALIRVPTTSEVGIIDISKIKTWLKLGLNDDDTEEEEQESLSMATLYPHI